MTVTKIILMACGSFNPPTIMHLRMFEIARDYLNRLGNYEVIGGLISPVHDAYGKQDLASATDRLAMAKLALLNSDWIRLSDWECRQETHTRTVLVLRHHQNKINTILNNGLNDNINEYDTGWSDILRNVSGTVKIKLLCGGDLLQSFDTPGLWLDEDIDEIVGQHGLAVISRENCDTQKFIYMSDVLTKYMNNITIVTEWIKNDVSSTKVRRAIRRNESVKYIVPDKVIEYIDKNGLYGSQKNKYLLQPIYNSSLTPSPIDVSMDSPSPTNSHCINICNNNLFSNKSGEIGTSVEAVSKMNFLNAFKHPGQAVKIITESTGDHKILKKEIHQGNCVKGNEVCASKNESKTLKTSKSYTNFQMLETKWSLLGSSSNESLKGCKSCDENLIKFIFTKHGIQVISDVETIV